MRTDGHQGQRDRISGKKQKERRAVRTTVAEVKGALDGLSVDWTQLRTVGEKLSELKRTETGKIEERLQGVGVVV